MSLVNDLLRDLDARRAAPGEWPLRDALQPVNEAAAARRDKIALLRRAAIWFGVVMLLAIVGGLIIARLVNGSPELPLAAPSPASTIAPEPAPLTPPLAAAVVAIAAAPLPQLLDVLPQNDGQRLVLQLLLDRSVAYQRSEENGAVSFYLPDVQLRGEPYQGRVQSAGRSLSWRVEARGAGAQVLLVGLGDQLQVHDRLEAAGDRWLLWLDVPLQHVPTTLGYMPDDFPMASAAFVAEPELPDWSNRQVPAANAEPTAPPAPSPPRTVLPTGPAHVQITSRQPDALSQARQALLEQNYPRAIAQLQTLHQRQSSNSEVARLLAQAYLANGQPEQLLSWLPAQLQARPHDSELRMLLARAQLQTGAMPAAVATLQQNSPGLAAEPGYHALLAASYQQTRQWQQSAALYQQLVNVRPSQATWQLGLAIALEQLEHPDDAAKHYSLALEGQGLDVSSRNFAAERAATLRVSR